MQPNEQTLTALMVAVIGVHDGSNYIGRIPAVFYFLYKPSFMYWKKHNNKTTSEFILEIETNVEFFHQGCFGGVLTYAKMNNFSIVKAYNSDFLFINEIIF